MNDYLFSNFFFRKNWLGGIILSVHMSNYVCYPYKVNFTDWFSPDIFSLPTKQKKSSTEWVYLEKEENDSVQFQRCIYDLRNKTKSEILKYIIKYI